MNIMTSVGLIGIVIARMVNIVTTLKIETWPDNKYFLNVS